MIFFSFSFLFNLLFGLQAMKLAEGLEDHSGVEAGVLFLLSPTSLSKIKNLEQLSVSRML